MNIPSLDLSKAPHPRSVELFMPFLPGWAFGIAIIWANPAIRGSLQQSGIAEIGYYSRIGLGLFTAYFVGLVALTFANLIQRLVGLLYFAVSSRNDRVRVSCYNFISRLPQTSASSWPIRLIKQGLTSYVKRQELYRDHEKIAFQVWMDAAERLLNLRGISLPEGDREEDLWSMWVPLLGTPFEKVFPADKGARALGASGWLGLVAVHLAPNLWNLGYGLLIGTLLLIGFVDSWAVAKRWGDPLSNTLHQVICVVDAIGKVPTAAQNSDTTTAPPVVE